MALGPSSSLSAGEGRRFGLTVGLAFLALAGFAWWRARWSIAVVLGIVAGLLLLAAILLPSHLGPIQRAWMRGAQQLSRVTLPIIVGVLYFGVITPTGILMRLVGRNPLTRRRRGDPTYWVDRGDAGRSDLRRQF